MKATYVGGCSEGVEVDGVAVLPGQSVELPDDAVLNPEVWKVEAVKATKKEVAE